MSLARIPRTSFIPDVRAPEPQERAAHGIVVGRREQSAFTKSVDAQLLKDLREEIARLENEGETGIAKLDPAAELAVEPIIKQKQQRDVEKASVAGRERVPADKLPEPPANEPVLIRRLVVPPEALALEEAVDKNAYVYRSGRLIADNIASIPLRVMRRTGDPDEPDREDTTTPAARRLKRILERPNAHMSGNDFVEALSIYMESRECLLWMMWDPRREMTRPKDAEGKPPDALYFLPARRTIKMLYEGALAYYRIAGVGMSVPAWQVIRLGYLNPKEELRGLSPLSAAFQAADTGYAIELYHANSFEQGLKLSGLISLKDEASDDQFSRYKSLVDQYTGVGNAHAVLVLDKGASFSQMAATPKDMEFGELNEVEKKRIGTAFGIHPFNLGDNQRINRSVAQEAKRGLWENKLIPTMHKIVSKLNVQLVPYFQDKGPEMYLEFDLSAVEAMSQDRVEFATAFMNVATGCAALLKAQGIQQSDVQTIMKDRFDIDIDAVETREGEIDSILADDSDPSQEFIDPFKSPISPQEEGKRMPSPVLRRLRMAALTRAQQGRALTGNDAERILLRIGATKRQAKALGKKIGSLLSGVHSTECADCGHTKMNESEIRSVFDNLEARIKQ